MITADARERTLTHAHICTHRRPRRKIDISKWDFALARRIHTHTERVQCTLYTRRCRRVFRYRPYIRPALVRGNFFGERRLEAVMRGLPRNWCNWQSAQLVRVSRRRERLIVASPVGLNSPLTLKRDALALPTAEESIIKSRQVDRHRAN